MKTPILLLVFNRPLLTQLVFDSIKTARPEQLFVAFDGPRIGYDADIQNVKKIEQIINSVDWDCRVLILRREENLGVGVAVSSAIDWFFEHVDEGIILEDDCIPSMSFFRFCEDMLVKYRNINSIMAVNGSNPCPTPTSIDSYFFSSYNLIWGWATWRRAWQCYKFSLNEISNTDIFLNLMLKFKFNFVSVRSWYKHLNLVRNGSINTWDYQWIYSCFRHGGLIITPKVNLVENMGNFENPTHINNDALFIGLKASELHFPLMHPPIMKINHSMDYKIKKHRFGNTFRILLANKLLKMFPFIKKNV